MKCTRCNTPIPRGAASCPTCNAPAPPALKRAYGLYVFGVLLLAAYIVVLLPMPSRDGPSPQIGMGLIFWTAVFGYFRAKRIGGKPWLSAATGAAVGLAVFIAAAFIAGMRS